jgi:hypothetical protein
MRMTAPQVSRVRRIRFQSNKRKACEGTYEVRVSIAILSGDCAVEGTHTNACQPY